MHEPFLSNIRLAVQRIQQEHEAPHSGVNICRPLCAVLLPERNKNRKHKQMLLDYSTKVLLLRSCSNLMELPKVLVTSTRRSKILTLVDVTQFQDIHWTFL